MRRPCRGAVLRIAVLLLGVLLAACSKDADVEAESLRLAQFYLQDHQYREAIFSARKALAFNPRNIAAYRVIGRAMLANGQGAEAERIFRAAVELGDSDPQTRLDIARAMLLQGRSGAVLRYVEEIRTESDAQKGERFLLRAEAYLNLGALESARSAVQAALEKGAPRGTVLIALARVNLAEGRPDVATQLLDEAAGLDANDPNLWHWRGQIALLQEKFELAEEAFTRALEHDREPARRSRSVMGMMRAQIAQGKVANALQFAEQLEYQVDRSLPDFMRGLDLFRAGKLEEAESVLESVMERRPGDSTSGMLLGAINFEKGNYSLAESYLSDYVSADSSPLGARKMLAAIHLKQGRPREAFLLLKDTLDVPLDDPALDVLVGLSALGMGNYQLAEHHLTRARDRGKRSKTVLLGLAKTYLFTGQTEQAIALAEDVLAMDADSVLAKPIVVQAYLMLGRGKRALAATRAWVKKAPYDIQLQLLHARVAASLGNIDEAITTLDSALQIRSDTIEVRLLLAELLRTKGDVDQARQHYRQVLKQEPEHAAAAQGLLMTASIDGAEAQVLDTMQAHLHAHPGAIVPRLVLAQFYLARGMAQAAEKQLQDVLALQPDMMQALALQAQVRVAQGRIDDALAIYEHLSAQHPESELALVAKAQLLLEHDRTREALPVARQAVAINPDSIPAHVMLFEAARQAGDDALVREALARIQARWPEQALAERLQADALMREGKPAEALVFYQTAWQKQPSQAIALNLFAARFQAGKQAAALTGLEDWLKAHPRDIRARRLIANAYQRSGKQQQAGRHYQALLKLQPDDVAILNNLAWLYMETGNREALKLARRAWELAGNNPSVMDTYGMVLLKFGKHKQAIEILGKAARLAPGDAEIGKHLAEARSPRE